LSWMIRGPWRNFVLKKSIHMCHKTLQEADLINVANVDDKVELERRGFKSEKIIVIPYGLTAERRKEFLEVTPEPPSSPRIAFVGTFDLRKGGGEFPEIVSNVVERFPQARFRLLGARYRTKEQVLRYFPRRLRPYLEVITEYQPHELPNYLKDCSLGIFPSYIEGFGFGVLEMLAASLPVIGYDAPGTTMILPPHFLVSRGDAVAMSRKIIDLLIDKAKLVAARSWAKQRSFDFSWEVSAQQTLEGYTRHLEELRRASR
jgi:glycosyltransferase involved in cell wall biosynthesis